MKTQIGARPNFTRQATSVGNTVKSSGQTEGAVQPVTPPAETGEEKRSPDPDVQNVKSQHPALENNARLTIEKDQASGTYIYKTVHRETGEVIKQWPREKMLKAIASYQNIAGLIIDKKI